MRTHRWIGWQRWQTHWVKHTAGRRCPLSMSFVFLLVPLLSADVPALVSTRGTPRRQRAENHWHPHTPVGAAQTNAGTNAQAETKHTKLEPSWNQTKLELMPKLNPPWKQTGTKNQAGMKLTPSLNHQAGTPAGCAEQAQPHCNGPELLARACSNIGSGLLEAIGSLRAQGEWGGMRGEGPVPK